MILNHTGSCIGFLITKVPTSGTGVHVVTTGAVTTQRAKKKQKNLTPPEHIFYGTGTLHF
jgi:hypothetical protein